MFHDKVLNWSFLVSLGANLLFVSLIGNSDLFKVQPVPIPRVFRHLPFVMIVPPPVQPPIAKPQPQVVNQRTPQPTHRYPQETARVSPKQAHPVRLAKLTATPRTMQTTFRDTPTQDSAGPTTGPVPAQNTEIDPTELNLGGGGGVTKGKIDGGPPQDAKPAGDTPQTVKTADPPVVTHRPVLADRTEPKALTEWSDITASTQFDSQTLTNVVIKVQFDVGATGVPSHIKVIQSSGNAELDQNAVEACRAMRFAPAVQDGIARTMTYEHDFALAG